MISIDTIWKKQVLTLGTFDLVLQTKLIDISSSAVSRNRGRIVIGVDEIPAFTSDHIGVLRVSLVVMMSAAHVGDGDELLISKYDRKMRGTYWYSSSSSSMSVTKSVRKTLHLVGLGLVVSSHMAAIAYLVVVRDNDVVLRLGSSLRTRRSLNCGSALS